MKISGKHCKADNDLLDDNLGNKAQASESRLSSDLLFSGEKIQIFDLLTHQTAWRRDNSPAYSAPSLHFMKEEI